MIYLLVGANSYRLDQSLREIIAKQPADPEYYSGEDMTLEDLADIMTGQSLFAQRRVVVIRGAAANKPLWDKLGEWVGRLSDETTLVLVEPAVDKRTKGYKTLASHAQVIEAADWTDRQAGEARQWVRAFATERGGKITPEQETAMVERAIRTNDANKQVIDQGVLHKALEAIVHAGEPVTNDMIDAVLPPSTYANVFSLLEMAVRGEQELLGRALERLRHSDDPYKIMGLLASQWAQLVAANIADRPSAAVASELKIAPFAAQSSARLAERISQGELKRYTRLLADLDYQMKSLSLDPWLAVERFLLQLAAR